LKKKLLALLMGTSLVLAACGGGDDDAKDKGGNKGGDTASANGEELYNSKGCSACHGGDLKGGVGPDLTAIGGTLSADEIKTVILDGKGNMPAQNVSDDEAQSLADWLAAKK